jgi:hypothetical protein
MKGRNTSSPWYAFVYHTETYHIHLSSVTGYEIFRCTLITGYQKNADQ